MGIHSAIEFGNRMLTFVVAAVAIATLRGRLALRPAGASLRLAFLLALGVPAQAVIGGITVLTDLNPWIVSLPPAGLAGDGRRSRWCCSGGSTRATARRGRWCPPASSGWPGRRSWSAGLVLYVGTVVTGSGPHAGDVDAPRNGLDPRALTPAAHRPGVPAASG